MTKHKTGTRDQPSHRYGSASEWLVARLARVETEILEARVSRFRPNVGVMRLRNTTLNQKDEPVETGAAAFQPLNAQRSTERAAPQPNFPLVRDLDIGGA
jgi:hypothetical protein